MEGGFCSTVCILGAIAVIIVIIVQIYKAVQKKKEEREEAERARQKRIADCKGYIISLRNEFLDCIRRAFGENSRSAYEYSFDQEGDRELRYVGYSRSYKHLMEYIEKIEIQNENLKKDDPTAGREDLIAELTNCAEQFKQFAEKIEKTTFKTLIIANDYGKIDKSYWDEIRNMNAKFADETIKSYDSWLEEGNTENFSLINPELIPKCAWFYATEKPYSAPKFKAALDTFSRIHGEEFADLTIAEFYAIKQMGGSDVLRERIRDMLKNNKFNNEELTMIASGLMWMNAYQEENMVLQHMLATGQQMTPKTQERLHSLSNGGGKAPAGFDVVSNQQEMYFDVSSLAWKDEEYTGLFESLAFQDKTLSYSLAVRDEDKELFITQGLQVPDMSMILKKISEVFSEEYGDTVKADLRHCIALSGSGEETMDGIIAKAQECKQLGLLVHVVRIGKKLNIKFYTLFTPEGTDLMSQKQQALSLFKKLSPSVTMWESSMKDTILMAIQQLLNSEPQAETAPAEDVKGAGEGPIF